MAERTRVSSDEPLQVIPIQTSLYDLSPDQITRQLEEWGEPRFRANQILHWLYASYAASIDEMTDLGKNLRTKLRASYTLRRLSSVVEKTSSDGWTRKWLLRMSDGSEVEAVLMEYEGVRRTACISSQAGCAMNCSFCATGQMGFKRNLRAGEIIEQVVWVADVLSRDSSAPAANGYNGAQGDKERLSNIVFMGMGEPFANYNNVMEAARRLVAPIDAGGMGLGARKLTISTVGIVPGIRRFSNEKMQINLAVSLHAATDELRSQLVPINKRYPLKDLSMAVHDYIVKTNRRVSFEWAMIDGINDTLEQAQALVELVRRTFDPRQEKRHMLHINMIPLNPTGGYRGKASQRSRIQQFQEVLDRANIPNTLRVRRGIDISAGCGQLKAEAAAKGVGAPTTSVA